MQKHTYALAWNKQKHFTLMPQEEVVEFLVTQMEVPEKSPLVKPSQWCRRKHSKWQRVVNEKRRPLRRLRDDRLRRATIVAATAHFQKVLTRVEARQHDYTRGLMGECKLPPIPDELAPVDLPVGQEAECGETPPAKDCNDFNQKPLRRLAAKLGIPRQEVEALIADIESVA
ncbi:hypothetical protein SARC_07646 [Sphaeroforma arctica JP610]|uniref:Uncharacterized protein n=1 Tax=Sphaeroforma arctica JP610 TaxID=667725 RepID=A0A0L0FTS0_9EUKA|nr:hypothetical protein SARC_07646 [Sphaeroforma arctica JP610]KNC79976.1 hypothetical protein SARC_07646 [Sphaeroforma arctica JP610]|eukprot:XP_014153878.1 hypothetical protein SARC_07646 [Sphaeroforma arctica JP610]